MQNPTRPPRLDGRTAARLRRIFRAALSLSLAGSAFGCARRISPSDLDTDVCTAGTFRPLAGATPSTPVDHLALRSEYESFGAERLAGVPGASEARSLHAALSEALWR
ncbi:MAG: hypothetical protein EPO40_33755 [Myxococcaceae bacterium]|nr:MAG: hypothetical protein EPO40_33755 [Myxococcaceae bacterium]